MSTIFNHNYPRQFAATRWSIVLAAGSPADDSARKVALEELARIYWFPLYAFLRRNGQAPPAAEDLTQSFFAHLLDKQSLRHVDRAKGKFRSFLLAALKNFLVNEHDKATAAKRGGGTRIISWDTVSAESRYAIEPSAALTPERVFERRWAHAVLDRVLERLREHYATRKQTALFEALKGALLERPRPGAYDAIAGGLQMSPGAVVVAAHRLRRRYRELLQDEIAQTVASPELIDEEIRYLLACL